MQYSWHTNNSYSFTRIPWGPDSIYDTADKGQRSAYFFPVVVIQGNMSTRICVNALKCNKCVQIRACSTQVNYTLKREHSLTLSWSVNEVYSLVTDFANIAKSPAWVCWKCRRFDSIVLFMWRKVLFQSWIGNSFHNVNSVFLLQAASE